MSSIKLIALDLDGTLLDSRKNISPRNLEALKRAHERGIHIVPATGRFFEGIPEYIRSLEFVRYIIETNGAIVSDSLEGKVLSRVDIPCDRALEVLRYFRELPGIYDAYVEGHGRMDKEFYDRIPELISDPESVAYMRRTRRPVDNLYDYIEQGGLDPQKLQIFFPGGEDQSLRLKEARQRFPDLSVTTALGNNIEINAYRAQKGFAIESLCKHLGLELSQAMAVGDGLNDMSMIRMAGLGVAMKNAAAEVLAAADHITDDNDSDGVALAIERFCLA